MDRDLIIGAIGAGGAILGSITGAIASALISHVSNLRRDRIRILIDVEEYLDELLEVSNLLYHLKESEFSCSDDEEEKEISIAYGQQLDKFFSIWDQRKRVIELNVYFNDPECLWLFRRIERLYEKSKNKIAALSSSRIINNDRLLGSLLNIEEDIGELRDLLSRRLRLYLSSNYILFPTFSNWGARAKEWLLKESDEVDNPAEKTEQ